MTPMKPEHAHGKGNPLPRPRIDLVLHFEDQPPRGHGWGYADHLTNTGLLQEHVRSHYPDPGEYDEPARDGNHASS